jgi:hypothetical protein
MYQNYLFQKKLLLTLGILFILIGSFSCNKEKKLIELISGGYTLEYASIDGEDVTALLLNDTVNLHSLVIAKSEEVGSPFFFYFDPIDDYYAYAFVFSFLDENTLSIYNPYWGTHIPAFIDDNVAFLPFSKQEKIILNIETLSENQLSFNTIYLDKTYKYEFKD